jgi:hypothetical protein
LKAVSGIMLTMLFLGVPITAFNIQPAKADQGPQLLLETDKNVYILGENVTIVLSNIGTETIQIGGYPIWEIHTYPEEEPVYPSIFAFLAWSLEPGENDTIAWNQTNQFTHSPVEAGMYVVRDLAGWGLSAYFEIVPTGDINDDGIVDIIDVVVVALAFGSRPEDENWNPIADIAEPYSLIDIIDMVAVALHFGQTYQ